MSSIPLPSQSSLSFRDRILKKADFWRVFIVAIGFLLTIGGSFLIGGTDKAAWAFAGILGIGITLAVIVRPHYGMYLLVFVVYTNISTLLIDAFGLPSLNKILVALIFVSVMATQILMRRRALIFRPSEAMILVYIIVTSISTILSSGANADSFDSIVDVLKDFVIIFIIVQLAQEEKVWRRAQWILIISATLLSILTWYQFFTGDYANEFYGLATSRIDYVSEDSGDYIDIQRVGGPVGDPNFYAQMLVMVYPLSLYRMLGQRSRNRRVLAGASMILIAGAIVFTYSRATLLVMIVVTLMILLERRINVYKIAAAGLAMFILVLPVLPEGYIERMLTIIGVTETAEEQTDVSATGRLSEALVAMQMFRDHPVLGAGYSTYESNYLDYSVKLGLDSRIEDRQAHNMYLEILAETGIIGMMAFSAMIIVIFQALQQARQKLVKVDRADLIPWVLSLQFGLIAYLINSIFLHDSYARYFRLSIALAVSATALAEALYQKHNAELLRKRSYGEETLDLTA